jgi:GTP-binding protein
MLFNKIAGKRLSIVEDTPGVTRDRLYASSDWAGYSFSIVDTGGIEPKTDSEMLKYMREQALLACEMADVIIFVCDLRTGVTAEDKSVASLIKRYGKPVVLAVNKADSTGLTDPGVYEFYSLGMGDPIPVSALHGHGSGDLLDECIKYFAAVPDEEEDGRISVAIIGKPNAGKSSLINKILGETRVVVSPVAGTTRDAIDAEFENEHGKFLFIDTAGLRKKSRIDTRIEAFSRLRAEMAVERADVCVIMIDAQEGLTEQDTKVAGLAHEAGKASIIMINKWDAIEKETNTQKIYTENIRNELKYMSYAPVIFVSALTGQRVTTLFPEIVRVYEESRKRISTGQLNSLLADLTMRVPPPTDKGRRLKIFYITQVATAPPTFAAFVNERELFHFSYRRYIENGIRAAYGFEGSPVRFAVRQRGENED